MKVLSSLALLLSVSFAHAAPVASDVHRTLDDLHYAIDHQRPSDQELAVIQGKLQDILDLVNKRPAGLVCSKASNGLFYPANRSSGAIVGDEGYSAGHAALQDCKATLPKTPDSMTCFKRNNGRFYPTNPTSGVIVGSSAYSAGYAALAECLASIQ